MATWMSYSSATVRDARMAAGVEPQSSWILRPGRSGHDLLHESRVAEELPLPSSPKFMGRPSTARSIISMFQGPR